MPSVFLSQATMDYLKRASNGQSMDATVRRLLNLERASGGQLVRRQVSREKLAPFEAYTWTILSRLQNFSDDNPQLLRSELQKQVGDSLRAGGLFEIYPDDAAPTKNKQPRWKQRFNAALAYLKKNGCVVDVEKAGPERWKRVKYRGTDNGLDLLWDIDLHLEAGLGGHCYLTQERNPPEDSLGNPLCPKPLESWEIPGVLVGRQKGKLDAEV